MPGGTLDVADDLGVLQNDYDPQNYPLEIGTVTYPVAGAQAHGTLGE